MIMIFDFCFLTSLLSVGSFVVFVISLRVWMILKLITS